MRELLDRPLVAHISTVNPSGRPQGSVVWFERREQDLVIFSEADTPKVRNLRRNPSIDVVVLDPDRNLGAGIPVYVRLSGTAVVRPPEPGIEHRMAKRYGHPDGYPYEVGELVNIHVTARRLSGLGPIRSGWA